MRGSDICGDKTPRRRCRRSEGVSSVTRRSMVWFSASAVGGGTGEEVIYSLVGRDVVGGHCFRGSV
jgi:hypothetical protein